MCLAFLNTDMDYEASTASARSSDSVNDKDPFRKDTSDGSRPVIIQSSMTNLKVKFTGIWLGCEVKYLCRISLRHFDLLNSRSLLLQNKI